MRKTCFPECKIYGLSVLDTMADVRVQVDLFVVCFLWWEGIEIVVWQPKENHCVCFPLQKAPSVHLASARFNPGLFALFCWEGRQKGTWMVYVTWGEEEKILVFYCCCWKIVLSVLPVSKVVILCYYPLLSGKERKWMSSSSESRNPHFHFNRLLFWNFI